MPTENPSNMSYFQNLGKGLKLVADRFNNRTSVVLVGNNFTGAVLLDREMSLAIVKSLMMFHNISEVDLAVNLPENSPKSDPERMVIRPPEDYMEPFDNDEDEYTPPPRFSHYIGRGPGGST